MDLLTLKQQKFAKIRKILRHDLSYQETDLNFNFLSAELKKQFDIVDTENVSANNYDPFALELIEKYPEGLVLDCGAGKRSVYYPNVVNFEIVSYDTTDVLGVGEELPFQDNAFESVLSLNVLEHVKDPFRCAAEISRVLKPGGKLYCVVPFLQPLHAYPHHYYNMTDKGLSNLFAPFLTIDKQDVIASGWPIFALTWMLNSWVNGLPPKAQKEFLNMKVADLLGNPVDYFNRAFVTELPREKKFELACTTALFATKPQ